MESVVNGTYFPRRSSVPLFWWLKVSHLCTTSIVWNDSMSILFWHSKYMTRDAMYDIGSSKKCMGVVRFCTDYYMHRTTKQCQVEVSVPEEFWIFFFDLNTNCRNLCGGRVRNLGGRVDPAVKPTLINYIIPKEGTHQILQLRNRIQGL